MVTVFYDFFAELEKRNGFYEEVVANAKRGSDNVLRSFFDLENYLKLRCSDWPSSGVCPILISIDEVHVLYAHRSQDRSDYTLYSRLKSVLYELRQISMAVLCLSTASHIPSLAPSKEIAPSMRERSDERKLPAPFTELPFDVFAIDDPLVSGKEFLNSVGSMKFAAKFGRPL